MIWSCNPLPHLCPPLCRTRFETTKLTKHTEMRINHRERGERRERPEGLSLTPCFSWVLARPVMPSTVSTVSHFLQRAGVDRAKRVSCTSSHVGVRVREKQLQSRNSRPTIGAQPSDVERYKLSEKGSRLLVGQNRQEGWKAR